MRGWLLLLREDALRPADISMPVADVTSCEPDVKVAIDVGSAKPNDPDYVNGDQWDMPLIGVPQVWALNQFGSHDVKVCMVSFHPGCRRTAGPNRTDTAPVLQIDTGSDLQHPDLISNLWINPVEAAGPGANAANGYINGIDDDGNGASLAWGAACRQALLLVQRLALPAPS